MVEFQKPARVCFVNPLGSVVRLTRKDLIFNVLDSSFDLSSYASVGNRCVWWPGLRFSVVSRTVEFCRFQGVMIAYTLVLARKSFHACCLFRELLALGFVTVLVVDPFAIFDPNCLCRGSLFIFFVAWFRARTRVRRVAPVTSEFLLE